MGATRQLLKSQLCLPKQDAAVHDSVSGPIKIKGYFSVLQLQDLGWGRERKEHKLGSGLVRVGFALCMNYGGFPISTRNHTLEAMHDFLEEAQVESGRRTER